MSAEDHELLRRFRNGDEQAFNTIVRLYQEKVYWVARRFVTDHDEADDIVQEVFVRAYKAFKEFRGDAGIFTWLYRITVNLSLNAIRRRKVRDFLQLDQLFVTPDAGIKNPDEVLEDGERADLIAEAIDRLPEKQKAVFILRYYEELPYEEISKMLKTSVGGLKANYFHAVKKIGQHLKKAYETR